MVTALPPAATGTLAEVSERIAVGRDAHDSAYLLLPRNDEALNWRLALADHASTSIDAQYFIWDNDATGRLLFDRLLKAADRGVRVRLLVDDLTLATDDRTNAAISHHPYFEIKVFNPAYTRHGVGGWFEFLSAFRELTRRMHNKLFIVDNRIAIVGGRNIGNAYFVLSETYDFRDLDLLTSGPVVQEMSAAFDDYWNAELPYPVRLMSTTAWADDLGQLRREINACLEQHADLL